MTDYCHYQEMTIGLDFPTHSGRDAATRSFRMGRDKASTAKFAVSDLDAVLLAGDDQEAGRQIELFQTNLDLAVALSRRAHSEVDYPIKNPTPDERKNMGSEMEALQARVRKDMDQRPNPRACYGHQESIQKCIRCVRILKVLSGEAVDIVRAALWDQAHTFAVQARSEGEYAMRSR